MTFPERFALGHALTERIAKAIGERDRDDVVRELASAGVPASPILSQPEMVRADVFRAHSSVADGPDGAPVMQHPLQYRDHPAASSTRGPAAGRGARARSLVAERVAGRSTFFGSPRGELVV